ncbi:MAG: cyclic pyranopterin monophosphate synthase MoaC [Nitriliruptoraceae bacterium]|nr:cyclic pyranopterin monophosphate synthase MoaC [Nitriliruptoraceae bacterium]
MSGEVPDRGTADDRATDRWTTEGGAPAGPDSDRPGADGLTHLDERGHARMVDVADKDVTTRTAVACCTVVMAPATARLLADGTLPKGDALPVARIAGIQAAKRTPELIPLCHGIALTSVEVAVDVDVDAGTAEVTATATARDRTGVEMEAMTAASVAALTLYDLCKAVQKDVVITQLRLRRKTGGRSGDVELP